MRHWWVVSLYGFFFAAFLSLAGCPPSPSKPVVPASPQPKAAEQKPSGEMRAPGQPSSLEAFRRGEEIPSVLSSTGPSPLKDIYFDYNRYGLRPDARETLKANVQWLKANPSRRIEIEGHADERGTNEYNLALGARRAQAAKDYLATLGISPDRLSTISYGEELPVCREETEECWQKNRRAHFVVIMVQPSS